MTASLVSGSSQVTNPKDKDDDGNGIVDSEDESGELIRVYKCDDEDSQLFVAKEDTLPGRIVLVSYKLGIGFAIPAHFAHQLGHMIHEGLAAIGGDPIEIDPKKTETYH